MKSTQLDMSDIVQLFYGNFLSYATKHARGFLSFYFHFAPNHNLLDFWLLF